MVAMGPPRRRVAGRPLGRPFPPTSRRGGSLPPEERPLLEAQAGQDLLNPRVRERPDPLPLRTTLPGGTEAPPGSTFSFLPPDAHDLQVVGGDDRRPVARSVPGVDQLLEILREGVPPFR